MEEAKDTFPGHWDLPTPSPNRRNVRGSSGPRSSLISRLQTSDTIIEMEPKFNLTGSRSMSEEIGGTQPLCTPKVLQNFGEVDRRARAKQIAALSKVGSDDSRIKRESVDTTFKALRAWYEGRHSSVRNILQSLHILSPPKVQPSKEEIDELIQYHFPNRGDIPVRIIDFYKDKSKTHKTKLSNLIEYDLTKPSDVIVRWIHAPLGPGLLHSTIEDLFLGHRAPRSAERRTSSLGSYQHWPYREIEVLNLVNRKEYEAMCDLWHIGASEANGDNDEHHQGVRQANRSMAKDLGLPQDVLEDLDWRAEHLDVNYNFWTLAASDIPTHLTQISLLETSHGPLDGLRLVPKPNISQTLWDHPKYKNAQIVRNQLRCFHRSDGFLLTMGAINGVDYLDKDLNKWLDLSQDERSFCEDASVLGFLFERFAIDGAMEWPSQTVEWLLVYILTEYAATPHTIRQGRNIKSLTTAYQENVEKLKLRRYENFQRKESMKLVRDFLVCADELAAITVVLESKLRTLEELKEQVKSVITEPPNGDGKNPMLASARIDWAMDIVRYQHTTFQALASDVRLSTQTVFQLRSIEQNELAIVADSQNKAVLVFTGVTVIFLPLSVFTGYFGMNLKGVVDTQLDEKWFWKVCGSIAFTIVFLASIYALRRHLPWYNSRRFARQRRENAQIRMPVIDY